MIFGNKGDTYSPTGNNLYSNDGRYHTKSGNNIYDNKGGVGMQFGNNTYYKNKVIQKSGSTYFVGSHTYRLSGTTLYGPNGRAWYNVPNDQEARSIIMMNE